MAQSLKNDGGADLQIDEEFSPKCDYSAKINAFDTNLENAKFTKLENDIEYSFVKKTFFDFDPVFCLNVVCEQRDIAERKSTICIQAKIKEKDNIINYLDSFLKKSGRTISDIQRKSVKKIIKSKVKELEAAKYILLNYIKGKNK